VSQLGTEPPVVPDVTRSTVVVDAPGKGPGFWAGGPSAALADDGTFYLAYRLRRPTGEGRGYANVVARSSDGERFETVSYLDRKDFDSDSLERPALARVPGGGWHLYVSCATPGSPHWRVDLLSADNPEDFTAAGRRTVLPGDERTGVKDPVVTWYEGRWHLWLCCHPLDRPEDTDRMTTRYGTSVDGISWQLGDIALQGRPGSWDGRGARIVSVLLDRDPPTAYYDGRASAEENAEERTGIAIAAPESSRNPARFTALANAPAAVSPHSTGSLRYLSALPLPDGGMRLYYGTARLDGAHDLRTEYVPPSR